MTGLTFVVTGAARGLGAAIAQDIGSRGGTVRLADILVEEGEEVARSLRAQGIDARFDYLDVSSEHSVAAWARRLLAGDAPAGLVNNAALAAGVGGHLVHEIPVESWDAVLGVNLRGTWLVTRALVPAMIELGGGRIVNLGSDASHNGSERLAHYIASKGGVAALTRAMASDLGRLGITVNTVSPGLTLTEGASHVPDRRHELYAERRALQRAQVPTDVTGLVAFLLGPEGAYLTGQELVVNGGFVYH
ncbi:SDR family oxidoreductase [Streptomyces sp. NPDC055078]